MAISAPHYYCLKELHRRGILPQGGGILEIGEANWYGEIVPPYEAADSFGVVTELYRDLFASGDVTAVDMNGPTAKQLDLNLPIHLGREFKTVINHGTLEHVFNVAQVLTTMHDHCAVGGVMIHESPFTGWIDHGFWTIQPTLYFDLAAANHYTIEFMAVTQIDQGTAREVRTREQLLQMAANGDVPDNAMLFVVFRKNAIEPLAFPMQGYYARTISAEAQQAWREMR